ncbi:hypothetical protein HGRIS_007800 [Hohenbuehelia grisea]|uniref:Uncharacterized protein n=1 Tax=Hohenbuehelia grisea TaxID=104357 RepID=A0ABR3J5Z0_9AGAR
MLLGINITPPQDNSAINGGDLPSSGLIQQHWPSRLPDPFLLNHLIELFFTFHPHSNRILHSPSFFTSLSLPPNHPKFPSVPLLHAICAIGSLYTAIVTSPPLPNLDEVEPGMHLLVQKINCTDTQI